MTDTTLGYLLVALGIIFALVIVFTATSRDPRAADSGAEARPARPPVGVHLPPPSWLPVIMAVAAALLAAGLIFSPLALIPGLMVLLVGVLGWYRAAGREWRGTEHGEHHDAAAHE